MKDPGAPSAKATKLYQGLATELGATTGPMFGMPVLKTDGKAFAGLFGDAMNFKLTGDAHAKAMALKGAALFDPSGMGRPMKEWVVVPAKHIAVWPELAREAMAYVAGAAKKKPKR